jgi:hypothetical protein
MLRYLIEKLQNPLLKFSAPVFFITLVTSFLLLTDPLNPIPEAKAADTEDVEELTRPVGKVRLVGDPETEQETGRAEPAVAEDEPGLFPAPQPRRSDYPDIGISSRTFVWVIAQMHLFLAAFVLAVPVFVIVIEWIGVKTSDDRYDDMAHEFMKISMTAYSLTAIFGGALALALFLLYPQFMAYMMRVFNAQVLVYAVLFFVESVFLYLYYYSWYSLHTGNAKWVHLTIGLLLNTAGTTLLVIANSWSTFMMAPSGVNEAGAITGDIWTIMRGPLWNPLNLHRFIANIAFGGAVVGAYAAYKFLSARTQEARAHYDWMGYTANFIAILAFLPLPFAGYWLTAEMYAYSQQMGITSMGGILAWLFVLQAVLIGTILLAGNYYLWSGMSRTEGSKRYTWLIKYIVFVHVTCFLVWMAPHNLILSAAEMKALGGSYHNILGPLGLMPAKNIAVNLMLIFTFLSFQIYRRADKIVTVSWEKTGNALIVAIYTVAIINVIFTGIYYGYFTNTVYKVGSSVMQVVSTLSVIISGVVIDTLMFKGAKSLPAVWVRTHWHVYTIMKDNSADNFIPTISYVSNMVTILTVAFLLVVLFIFWIASLGESRQPQLAGNHVV